MQGSLIETAKLTPTQTRFQIVKMEDRYREQMLVIPTLGHPTMPMRTPSSWDLWQIVGACSVSTSYWNDDSANLLFTFVAAVHDDSIV